MYLRPILSLCFFRAFSAISCEAKHMKASPVLLPWKSTSDVIPFSTISSPAKNWTISSLLYPKGSPQIHTKPSLAMSGLFGPVCFNTQSISTLFDLNPSTCLCPSFPVFFHGQFDFIFCFQFSKSLATWSAFSGVDETNTLSPFWILQSEKKPLHFVCRARPRQAPDLRHEPLRTFGAQHHCLSVGAGVKSDCPYNFGTAKREIKDPDLYWLFYKSQRLPW